MAVDRKRQIMDAAEKSFSLFGYKATTMDQVARLANVGKGTIYTFFKNKEELFDEIVQVMLNDMKDTAEKSIDESVSFYENVHRSIYEIVHFRRRHQLAIKLFQEGKEMGTPAVLEVIEKMEGIVLSFIKEKIIVAVEAGEMRECNPEITAFIMLKVYIALIFDWEKKHEPLSEKEIAGLFELHLLKGLSI